MEVLFWIFLIGVFLFFFVPSIRLWLLGKLSDRLRRKMQDYLQQQMRQGAHASASGGEQPQSKSKDKLAIDEIEAKRFDKENSNDYVDFEELPN